MSSSGPGPAASPGPLPLALSGMVGYWDPDERNRFASHSYAASLGLSTEEMRGRRLEDVLGAERYARALPAVRAALAGRPTEPVEVPPGRIRPGKPAWAVYLPDSAGDEVYGVVVVVLDRPPAQAPAEALDPVDVLQERQRIAADLHDTVLQRLYAAGMSLTRALVGTDLGAESPYLRAIEDIDGAIVELRAAILSVTGDLEPSETASSIDRIVGRASRTLGFAPDLQVHGPLDRIPEVVARHLLAVLNEALSNVARHAGARHVGIVITSAPHRVELEIVDDGVGLVGSAGHSGVENIRRRAEVLSGRFTLADREPRGTVLLWSVPRIADGT